MAIIYTYPIKTQPADDDKILISDSEDDNKTKSVTIEDIRSATVSGVSSIIAGDGISLPSGSTGDVTIDATEYVGGDGIDIRTVGSTFSVAADLKANSGLVIDTALISLDLSASAISGTLAVKDGGSGAATFTAGFLKADGVNAFTTVSEIDLTTDVTEALPVLNGGTGTGSLTGVIVGNGSSAMTGGGDIDDLASAQYSTSANGSLYLGNIPSGLSGNPTANSIIGNGTGGLLTTGASNTMIGNRAGDTLTTGGFNTIIGAGADSAAAGNDSGVGIGQGSVVGDAGIAIGRAAIAGNNELAIGSTSYSITLDATSRTADTFLPIKVNGTQYYIQLYSAS